MKNVVKRSGIASVLATGSMLYATSAFADVCNNVASVGEIKVEKDWVATEGTNNLTKTGPEKVFVEIKTPSCDGNGVAAITSTAEQVFETIKEHQNGTLNPHSITMSSICAYYQAADILVDMKLKPEAFDLTAKQLSYSPNTNYKQSDFYKERNMCLMFGV